LLGSLASSIRLARLAEFPVPRRVLHRIGHDGDLQTFATPHSQAREVEETRH
jgi:hypothetical protein